jgi:hypothetical protein
MQAIFGWNLVLLSGSILQVTNPILEFQVVTSIFVLVHMFSVSSGLGDNNHHESWFWFLKYVFVMYG